MINSVKKLWKIQPHVLFRSLKWSALVVRPNKLISYRSDIIVLCVPENHISEQILKPKVSNYGSNLLSWTYFTRPPLEIPPFSVKCFRKLKSYLGERKIMCAIWYPVRYDMIWYPSKWTGIGGYRKPTSYQTFYLWLFGIKIIRIFLLSKFMLNLSLCVFNQTILKN